MEQQKTALTAECKHIGLVPCKSCGMRPDVTRITDIKGHSQYYIACHNCSPSPTIHSFHLKSVAKYWNKINTASKEGLRYTKMIYNNKEVVLCKSKYPGNKTLCLYLIPEEELDKEVIMKYTMITINIEASKIVADNEAAFVDINKYPDLPSFLNSNELAYSTGIKKTSGHNLYPLYKFYNVDDIPYIDEARLFKVQEIPRKPKSDVAVKIHTVGKDYICPRCGKKFIVMSAKQWQYRYDGKLVCSYTCTR